MSEEPEKIRMKWAEVGTEDVPVKSPKQKQPSKYDQPPGKKKFVSGGDKARSPRKKGVPAVQCAVENDKGVNDLGDFIPKQKI